MKLTGNLNLIIRWIWPVIYQPAPGTANLEVYGIEEGPPAYFAAQTVQQSAGVSGFGDMTPTFFLSPSKAHKLILGVGPVFVLPTATSKVLGQGKFSIGPSVVALVQPGSWTIGALINNAWSVAGPSDRSDVNQMTLQYFINYNLRKGWYLSSSPILLANWNASSGNLWTVPFGGGVGQVRRLGFQPVNISAQFYGNAVHPRRAAPLGNAPVHRFPLPQGGAQTLSPHLNPNSYRKWKRQTIQQLALRLPARVGCVCKGRTFTPSHNC